MVHVDLFPCWGDFESGTGRSHAANVHCGWNVDPGQDEAEEDFRAGERSIGYGSELVSSGATRLSRNMFSCALDADVPPDIRRLLMATL